MMYARWALVMVAYWLLLDHFAPQVADALNMRAVQERLAQEVLAR